MKIGILTLPLQANYGGILQAYALQTVIEQMGHQVRVIVKSRYRRVPEWKKIFLYPSRIVRKLLFNRHLAVREESTFNNLLDKLKNKQKYTDVFVNKYIHTLPIERFSELKESDFDAFVVGSDQIWRTKYAESMMQSTKDAYLYFARKWKNLKRVAYAASFGTDEWEYSDENTIICRTLIQQFDAVSIREQSGIYLCKKYLHYDNAVCMIDPSMLLNKEDYMQLIEKTKSDSFNGNIFSYFLDNNENTLQIEKFAEKIYGSKVFRLKENEIEEPFAPLKPVEYWFRAFHDAEVVITDSFHACAFSIIFNKPFWVIGNEARGFARFSSLLKLFGLEDRLIVDMQDIRTNKKIDWISINQKRESLVEKSLLFLNDNLG
ncbi:MAG: polysaccharide pyruvyl transferase family protein [Bacteroidales bacterium]|nr:polysaccharide pyruvyl transferase family protein [Bacteroidales bacterium]